jgi:6-phosphogluconolactonase/glucosamine-6-phosphate isomerase/deaminase
MGELQGILTTYEMRTSNENPSNKEATFKEANKDKKKVETETSSHEDSEEDMEEVNIVKNLKRGTGKYKGKLPLKLFDCGRIGHFASNFPFNKHSDGEEESNIKTKE